MHSQQQLVQSAVIPVGQAVLTLPTFLVLFGNFDIACLLDAHPLLLLGEGIEQLQSLNGNLEHVVMGQSEQTVSFLVDQLSELR